MSDGSFTSYDGKTNELKHWTGIMFFTLGSFKFLSPRQDSKQSLKSPAYDWTGSRSSSTTSAVDPDQLESLSPLSGQFLTDVWTNSDKPLPLIPHTFAKTWNYEKTL